MKATKSTSPSTACHQPDRRAPTAAEASRESANDKLESTTSRNSVRLAIVKPAAERAERLLEAYYHTALSRH